MAVLLPPVLNQDFPRSEDGCDPADASEEEIFEIRFHVHDQQRRIKVE
jgi:hypothetical protein